LGNECASCWNLEFNDSRRARSIALCSALFWAFFSGFLIINLVSHKVFKQLCCITFDPGLKNMVSYEPVDDTSANNHAVLVLVGYGFDFDIHIAGGTSLYLSVGKQKRKKS
jgi:hypothetical protein